MFKPFLKWKKISSDLELLSIGNGYWFSLKYEFEKDKNQFLVSLALRYLYGPDKILMAQTESKENILEIIKAYKDYANAVIKSL